MEKFWPVTLYIDAHCYKVIKLLGDESLSNPFKFAIYFISHHDNHHRESLGQKAKLVLAAAQSKRAIHGIITSISLDQFTLMGQARIKITLSSPLSLLENSITPYCHLYKTPREIIEDMITSKSPLLLTQINWHLTQKQMRIPQSIQAPRESCAHYLKRILFESTLFYWHQEDYIHISDEILMTIAAGRDHILYSPTKTLPPTSPNDLIRAYSLSIKISANSTHLHIRFKTNHSSLFPGRRIVLRCLDVFSDASGEYVITAIKHVGDFPLGHHKSVYHNTIILHKITDIYHCPKPNPIFFPATFLGSIEGQQSKVPKLDHIRQQVVRFHFDESPSTQSCGDISISQALPLRGRDSSARPTLWHTPFSDGQLVLLARVSSTLTNPSETSLISPLLLGGLTHKQCASPVTQDNANSLIWKTPHGHVAHWNDNPKHPLFSLQCDGQLL